MLQALSCDVTYAKFHAKESSLLPGEKKIPFLEKKSYSFVDSRPWFLGPRGKSRRKMLLKIISYSWLRREQGKRRVSIN